MLNESDYRLLLSVLEEPPHLLYRRERELVSEEPIPVDILVASSRPSSPPVWRVVELTPSDLVRTWRERQPDIQAFSLTIRREQETKRACVSRCPDGTIQEAYCSDTADDIVNCTELTTLRCGTGGASEFIGIPRVRSGNLLSREPRGEPA